MQTLPMAVVETAAGVETILGRTKAVPVRVAARLDHISEQAIYERCNRGTQGWISVFGEIWVTPRALTTGQVGDLRSGATLRKVGSATTGKTHGVEAAVIERDT